MLRKKKKTLKKIKYTIKWRKNLPVKNFVFCVVFIVGSEFGNNFELFTLALAVNLYFWQFFSSWQQSFGVIKWKLMIRECENVCGGI